MDISLMKIGFAVLFSLVATAAFAQAPQQPKTYTLSAPLVEEIFQRLSSASLATMLAGEVQRQPPPVTCPPEKKAEPAPAEPPKPPELPK
jgi:hypothetical protein